MNLLTWKTLIFCSTYLEAKHLSFCRCEELVEIGLTNEWLSWHYNIVSLLHCSFSFHVFKLNNIQLSSTCLTLYTQGFFIWRLLVVFEVLMLIIHTFKRCERRGSWSGKIVMGAPVRSVWIFFWGPVFLINKASWVKMKNPRAFSWRHTLTSLSANSYT